MKNTIREKLTNGLEKKDGMNTIREKLINGLEKIDLSLSNNLEPPATLPIKTLEQSFRTSF